MTIDELDACRDRHAEYRTAEIVLGQNYNHLVQALADWSRSTGEKRRQARIAVRRHIHAIRFCKGRVARTWAAYVREIQGRDKHV